PTVGALLLQLFSWRAIFVVTAIGAAALLIWALRAMERGEAGQESTGDLFSILLSIVGFGAVVYGLQQLLARAPQRSLAIGLLCLGVVALILFVRRQQRLAEPMLNLGTLENRLYRTGVLLIIITHLSIFGTFIVLPMYLVNVAGLLPFWAGVVMLPGGFIGALAPSIAGRLYDRLGARTLSMVGFFLLFAANLLFSLVAGTTNVVVLVAIYVLLMCGFGITLTPVQTHSLNQLQPAELTDGTAILNTCMLIASSMGGSLFIALLSGRSATFAAQGAAGDPFVAGMVFAYRIAAIVAASGLALSLFFAAAKGAATKK
ncbi:MAG TPA: MFS transporter, partial [Sphaerochaeta sp.]|nr:MFS transporter [Sphaerochaeta sp.]